MYSLKVEKLTCSRCVTKINNALKSVDDSAEIVIDLALSQLQITTNASLEAVRALLLNMGYPTTVL